MTSFGQTYFWRDKNDDFRRQKLRRVSTKQMTTFGQKFSDEFRPQLYVSMVTRRVKQIEQSYSNVGSSVGSSRLVSRSLSSHGLIWLSSKVENRSIGSFLRDDFIFTSWRRLGHSSDVGDRRVFFEALSSEKSPRYRRPASFLQSSFLGEPPCSRRSSDFWCRQFLSSA